MMQFDRIQLGRQARDLGFVRDTFEKVARLADILRFMEQDELLSQVLALKGGTAINLTIFDLPRLSVDIDLDFAKDATRDEMMDDRKDATSRINKYMDAAGYRRSLKSKYYHALDSFVYEYKNAGGMKDNLKIEINYMLRSHVLPVSRRTVKLPWLDSELTVLSVAPLEIYASKIVALMNRTAPRDIYDVHNMLRFGLFDESEQDLLRKCVVFYSAIGSEKIPTEFHFNQISSVPQYRIKTDLLPVLRKNERFNLKEAQSEITEYLSGLLIPTADELAFWEQFRQGEYRPELVFGQSPELERVAHHAMAEWKCSKTQSRSRQNDLSL